MPGLAQAFVSRVGERVLGAHVYAIEVVDPATGKVRHQAPQDLALIAPLLERLRARTPCAWWLINYSLLAAKGEAAGWKFFARLNENIPFYAKRGSEPPQKVAMGEAIVGLAPGVWDKLEAQGYPITYVFPTDGIPWWPAPVAIFKNAENMAAAKTLVDWALSEKGQLFLRSKDPRFPTREGVAPPVQLKDVDTANFIPMDFPQAGKDRPRVVAQWKREFGK